MAAWGIRKLKQENFSTTEQKDRSKFQEAKNKLEQIKRPSNMFFFYADERKLGQH
jgi:hypothetical protein